MMYVIAILLPIAAGAFILTGVLKTPEAIKRFSLSFAVLTSLSGIACAIFVPDSFVAVRFSEKLELTFYADGLSRLFALLVSVLWTPTTIYACEYMKHEGGERHFFGFFLMSFGVVLGIAFARNFFTMYVFYEYLTFATLPLVMHAMDGKARYAARKYLLYMVSGGALAFVAMLVLMSYGVTLDFVMGGVLDPALTTGHETLLRVMFLIGLAGFGVKAAIWPLSGWLPSASVAPTPVTALLHAVAVVKSGVFAIARLTFFSYGTAILAGSFAQRIMLIFAIFTILYGSAMALREPHLKRRLAYSTVSNLSYIVLGIALLNPQALEGAMLHMIFHAFLKITLFFCAGAILYKTGIEYASDMKGLGKRMPIVCGCFTVCALGLIGVPPLAAFHSKWLISTAAVQVGTPLAYAGVGALIVSEILTALYLFIPILNFYFPSVREADALSKMGRGSETLPQNCDPNALMTGPLIALCASTILLALFSGNIGAWIFGLLAL